MLEKNHHVRQADVYRNTTAVIANNKNTWPTRRTQTATAVDILCYAERQRKNTKHAALENFKQK